jgi:hypothetical protein
VVEALENVDGVVDADLLSPSESESNLWTTEIVLEQCWASVPIHVLAPIVEHDLSIADVSPQGMPERLQVIIR